MRFANRVVLQGYLEIERAEQIALDETSGLSAPVLHGWLWTDAAGLERHRVVLADKPALGLLEMLRKFNPTKGGSALVSINGSRFEVAHLDGKPFVAVEGRLLDGVVDVKHVAEHGHAVDIETLIAGKLVEVNDDPFWAEEW